MNQMAYFWAAAGFMAGIATAFFVMKLWRPLSELSAMRSPRTRWITAAGTLVFVAVAFGIYVRIGKPELPSQSATAGMASAISSAATSTAGPVGGAGSMAEATEKLSARLATSGGSDADWQLLEQSYEFLGDSTAADLAKQHKLKSTETMPASAMTAADAQAPTAVPAQLEVDDQATLVSYQQIVAKNPKDASAWLAIAQLQRAKRNFAAASAAFEHAVALKAMNADAWADYADASASLAGSLVNAKTRAAIDAALKLQPKHSKALWLKASLAYEERRYADALQLWQRLRSVLPDSSSDAAVVDANIAEARTLLDSAAAGVPGKKTSFPAQMAVAESQKQVRGSIAVDPALKQRVSADMTLFVFAKATDSPAPVAAYRTSVKSWPANFVLDDTLAMMPSRRLSQFDKVTVQARLSRSGQALPQSGDLQTEAIVVATNSQAPVSLHISKLVP
jgi:cytochrome c-type biogenesis protein CcmH